MRAVNERHRLISIILDRREVTSQQQLVELLAEQGVMVTQATVSRDLDRLGAVRVRRNGHMVYALPASEEPVDPQELLYQTMAVVHLIEASGNLCILKTRPAQAMPVARAFDQADLPEICGTIGGDDTILLIAREPSSGADLAELCRGLQLREARV
jgi:transcriptional regulator of arginine metabolism